MRAEQFTSRRALLGRAIFGGAALAAASAPASARADLLARYGALVARVNALDVECARLDRAVIEALPRPALLYVNGGHDVFTPYNFHPRVCGYTPDPAWLAPRVRLHAEWSAARANARDKCGLGAKLQQLAAVRQETRQVLAQIEASAMRGAM